MTARTKRILGWASVYAIYAALFLGTLACTGFVFHRLAVERLSFGYSRVWLRPWSDWYGVELAISTHGVAFTIDDGPRGAGDAVPK